jgi:integrase
VDLMRHRLTVRLNRVVVNGVAVEKAPKSTAGARPEAIGPVLLPELEQHLARYAQSGPDGYVFTGVMGGPLSTAVLNAEFDRARRAIDVPMVRLHDLRHCALTGLAQEGATLRDLMRAAGHSTSRAALIYQHTAEDRGEELAARLQKRAAVVLLDEVRGINAGWNAEAAEAGGNSL